MLEVHKFDYASSYLSVIYAIAFPICGFVIYKAI